MMKKLTSPHSIQPVVVETEVHKFYLLPTEGLDYQHFQNIMFNRIDFSLKLNVNYEMFDNNKIVCAEAA